MEVQVKTDCGHVRTKNEDSAHVYYNTNKQMLAILADGMGGYAGGEIASQMVVTQLGEAFETTAFDKNDAIQAFVIWLETTTQAINDRIVTCAKEDIHLTGMGTTIALVCVIADTIVIGHVGDSRVYRLKGDTLTLLTEDHSLVHELYQSGELTKEEADTHPKKNMLTRALGIAGTVQMDIRQEEWHDDEHYLICSDGLTNMIDDAHIQAILAETIDTTGGGR